MYYHLSFYFYIIAFLCYTRVFRFSLLLLGHIYGSSKQYCSLLFSAAIATCNQGWRCWGKDLAAKMLLCYHCTSQLVRSFKMERRSRICSKKVLLHNYPPPKMTREFDVMHIKNIRWASASCFNFLLIQVHGPGAKGCSWQK